MDKNDFLTTEQALQRLKYAFKSLEKEMINSTEAIRRLGIIFEKTEPKRVGFWRRIRNKIKGFFKI